MSVGNPQSAPLDGPRGRPPLRPSRLHRLLWDGVLPEALGLCFVAIIFGGFAAAYIITESAWHAQTRAAQQAEAQTLTQALADALGAAHDADAETITKLMTRLSQTPRVRALSWTGVDGRIRAEKVSGTFLATKRVPDTFCAQVRTPGGEAAGTLRVQMSALETAPQAVRPLWNWGVAAAATLLVFATVYQRLRRHLRPLAAIQQNLASFAAGIETQITTLALSDSLGGVARGWNQLIEQVTDLQGRLEAAQQSRPAADLLARFESGVFRRVVDRLPLGVLCVGPNYSIRYANPAATHLLGAESGELVGQLVSAAFKDPEVVQALLSAPAHTPAGTVAEHTRKQGDQETTLRFRIVPASDNPASGESVVTIEDIGQLRESQRARDNFLYHVTHELRTPLTNIHAYAETLTKPGFEDEQTRKECYNVIISETRRLSRLVEDILSVSQLEVGSARLDVGDVDLLRLLRQMVQDNLGAADEKGLDLTLAVPPKVPKVRGDKQRLSVLLNNLIGNAIKYTPAGGTVQVRLECGAHAVSIAVRDTGIGIEPQDQAHVFDKFYRAAHEAVQTVPGTGLGLAIAREVARLHGGEIRLESAPGQGSTFTVELPLPAATSEEATRK